MNLKRLKDIIASNVLVKIYYTMASFLCIDLTHQFVLRGDPTFRRQVHPQRCRLSIGQRTFQALHEYGACADKYAKSKLIHVHGHTDNLTLLSIFLCLYFFSFKSYIRAYLCISMHGHVHIFVAATIDKRAMHSHGSGVPRMPWLLGSFHASGHAPRASCRLRLTRLVQTDT